MKKTRWLLALVLALPMAACASPAAEDALRRIGDIGPRIADDIRPQDEGAAARKAEFLRLCEECRRLGER